MRCTDVQNFTGTNILLQHYKKKFFIAIQRDLYISAIYIYIERERDTVFLQYKEDEYIYIICSLTYKVW